MSCAKTLTIAALCVAALTISSCDNQSSPESPSPLNALERRNAIIPVVEDPESFLQAYGDAFVRGNISALSGLHASDFRYTTDGLCEYDGSCE